MSLPERAVSREGQVLWIATTVTFVGGIVALTVIILAKRPTDIGELGSVSDRWIAEHHVDSPRPSWIWR